METIEIYKKSGKTATVDGQAGEYLDGLKQEIESLQQWQEYYKSSGLDGQANLFERKAAYFRKKKLLTERGFPYPKISNEQLEVLNSVFNRCVPAEEFSAQSMPSDVVAAYIEAKEYKEVGVFDAINVMYYDGDPILIASKCGQNDEEQHYLLARWGDGLKPWEWFMGHYLNQKRANIPSLRLRLGVVIASIILIASYFLFSIDSASGAFFLGLGIMCFAVSVGFLVARSKAQKSYSRLLNEPAPSPFAAAAS